MNSSETSKLHYHADISSNETNSATELNEVVFNENHASLLLDKQNGVSSSNKYPSQPPNSTEEAKQSSMSLEELEGKLKFQIGTIVLGHIHGFPWWPAKLIEVQDNNKCSVLFYGPDQDNKALLSRKDIKPFNEQIAEKIFASLGITNNIATTLSLNVKDQYNFLQHSKHLIQVHSKQLKQATEEALLEYRSTNISNYTETANEDNCFVCGLGGFLILCDACDNSCHLQCASPPLMTVPNGEWFCMKCRNAKEQTAQSSRQTSKKRRRRGANAETKDVYTTNTAASNANGTVGAIPSEIDTSVRALDPIHRIVNKSSYWKVLHDKIVFNEFGKEVLEARKRSRGTQEDWDINTVTRHQKKQKRTKNIETLLQMIKSAPSSEKSQLLLELKRSITETEYDLMLINGEVDISLDEVNESQLAAAKTGMCLHDDSICYEQDNYIDLSEKYNSKQSDTLMQMEKEQEEKEEKLRLERKVRSAFAQEKRKKAFYCEYERLRRELYQKVSTTTDTVPEAATIPPIICLYENTPSDKKCRSKRGVIYIRYRVGKDPYSATSTEYNFLKIFFLKKSDNIDHIKLSTLVRLLALDLQWHEENINTIFEKQVEHGQVSWKKLDLTELYPLKPNEFNVMDLLVQTSQNS